MSPEQEGLMEWLNSFVRAKGTGGKSEASELLGITPSSFSKLTKTNTPFCEKTLKLTTLIQTTRDLSQSESPVRVDRIGPYTWKTYADGRMLWSVANN